MKGSYLGPSYSKNSVKDELENLGANYKILEKKNDQISCKNDL